MMKRKVTWLKNKKQNRVENHASCLVLLDVIFLSSSVPETGSCGNNWFLDSFIGRRAGPVWTVSLLFLKNRAVWRPEPLPHWTAFKQSEKQQQQGVRVAQPTCAQAVLFCLHPSLCNVYFLNKFHTHGVLRETKAISKTDNDTRS